MFTFEGNIQWAKEGIVVVECSFNQTAGPGVTLYDASKQHVHGKFHI